MCQKVMFDLPVCVVLVDVDLFTPGKRVETTGKYADISKN